MENWKTEVLGKIVTHKKGFAFKSIWFQEQGVPVIKVTNFTENSIDTNNLVFVPDKIANEKNDYRLFTNNIIIQSVGSWPSNPASVVGKVVRVPYQLDGSLLNQNAVVLYPKEKLDNNFLFYLLKHKNFKGYIINTAQGAANQASITLESIFSFQFLRPPLPIQKKIAAVLSAYDDLIENNNRRIAILEKTAEEIYREWFVRMRFPGHENVAFKKGVPEGWAPLPSSSVLKILSGGTPKTDIQDYWDGGIPFFTPRDAGNNFYTINTEKYIAEKGLEACNSSLYKKNTIFITARGTVGKIALAYRDMAMNQSCYALLPKESSEIYFYFLSLRNGIKYIKGVSKSGVFDNIVVDTFKIIPILMPTDALIRKFNGIAKSIFENIGCLLLQNITIKQTRDHLLPRLLSGKLSVENLDIKFPPGMEDTDDS